MDMHSTNLLDEAIMSIWIKFFSSPCQIFIRHKEFQYKFKQSVPNKMTGGFPLCQRKLVSIPVISKVCFRGLNRGMIHVPRLKGLTKRPDDLIYRTKHNTPTPRPFCRHFYSLTVIISLIISKDCFWPPSPFIPQQGERANCH